MTTYDAEKFLETTVRVLKEYVESKVNTRIYSVVMEFPGSIVDSSKNPIKKTIIHFEIDEIIPVPIGLGEVILKDNYDEETGTIGPQYGEQQLINFDVGIWASDTSGGGTSRLRAYQILSNIFGIGGINDLRDFSDGGDGCIEILSYAGGRFAMDTTANDSRLYRMIGGSLDVRVFSRTPPIGTISPVVTIDEIIQAPDLTISE